jgi:predicted membrane-bound dolichyl-phosphate-mannose-protein mannosyltransferase
MLLSKKLEFKKTLIVIIFLSIIIRALFLGIPNKTYADEGEYVVDARIIIKNGKDPNWQHPPLGKWIIASSIIIFGDNPIGWRIPSLIFAIVSIVVFYFICKELTGDEKVSLFATFLLSIDFMHIEMSKIGMLDMLFFAPTLAGFYFFSKKNPNYILAGILFGLGLSVKWTALLGIAATLGYMILNKEFELKKVLCLIIIPFLIYTVIFIPYFLQGKTILDWMSEQMEKSKTHLAMEGSTSKIEILSWLIGRPGFLVWEKEEISIFRMGNRSISFIGNPLVWLPGVVALAILLYKKGNKAIWFSFIWFTFFYIPWLIIPRSNVFIFYMLPVIPAFCLAISKILFEKYEKILMPYFILVLISFILFSPILLGI